MTTAVASRRDEATTDLDVRRIARVGGIAGAVMILIAAIGMLEAFNSRLIIRPILSLGYLVLFAVPFIAGWTFTRRRKIEGVEVSRVTPTEVVSGTLAGLMAGAMTGVFAVIVQAFPDMRNIFPKLSPALVELLTFGLGLGTGFLLLTLVSAAAAAGGASTAFLPTGVTRALAVGAEAVIIISIFQAVIDDLFDWFPLLPDLLYGSARSMGVLPAIVVFAIAAGLSLGLRDRANPVKHWIAAPDAKKRTRNSIILSVLVLVLFIVLPQLLGGILNELLTNVGIYLLMGLGLNIVIGLAGLLDLGYVAFFAVGAYTMAVLTSPISPTWTLELSWWQAFPFVLIAAAIAGIAIGTPVIRMRGDYLAIVTLGFGEIVRLTLLSDWLSPYFGGAQGIRQIPGIPIPFTDTEINATTPEYFIYAIIFFVALSAYVTWRLNDSRIGRAWSALREDEDVAEAVGVDTVKAKLLAFVTGAILASFAGALFAAKVGSVFTNSFEIIVSIVILVIVIVGGMGNVAGVAVGAIVLIGVLGGPNQPGLLQEFSEFKLLIYGALLVFVMLQRPEGILPSRRRAQELHQEEFLQDAWLTKGGSVAEDDDAREET